MRRSVLMLVLLLAAGLGGCAFSNPRNTPLLSLLDRNVKPETTESKVALGIVFVPAGVVCGGLDIAVVHPAHSLYLAGRDTVTLFWSDTRGTPMQRAVSVVPKAILTPVIFGFCWIGESLFDMKGPEEEAKP
ncbi:MAG: hypothetical protein WC485_12685, partial [Opitutaceae bacterium]